MKNHLFIFKAPNGHSFYRTSTGEVKLTDDSHVEFHTLDVTGPIVIGTSGISLPLVDGRRTPASVEEAVEVVKRFELAVRLGGTLIALATPPRELQQAAALAELTTVLGKLGTALTEACAEIEAVPNLSPETQARLVEWRQLLG